MGNVIPFPRQPCPIFYPSREEVEIRGKLSERWIVVTLNPDGTESWHGPLKTRKDAYWLTGILAAGAEKDRQRERDPLYQAFLALPEHEKQAVIAKLEALDNDKSKPLGP
jgi:hypothetical protein